SDLTLWSVFPTGSDPAFRVAPGDFSAPGLACLYESSLSCHFTGQDRRVGLAAETWEGRTRGGAVQKSHRLALGPRHVDGGDHQGGGQVRFSYQKFCLNFFFFFFPGRCIPFLPLGYVLTLRILKDFFLFFFL
uniref:Focadhesin n=1 Tax=Neovison vison TaxID=452646 RepID=A0A8C7B2D5_NEOVI